MLWLRVWGPGFRVQALRFKGLGVWRVGFRA